MISTLSKSEEYPGGINLPAVEAFCSHNGETHLQLACHAALPLGLTPELLYSIWANFQVDCYGNSLGIPWIATADLLLSNLCIEVGSGLYEMDRQVRHALLNRLEQDNHFGLKRVKELAAFLATYIQPQLNSEDVDIRDFAQAQNWAAMAYLCPEGAAKELATALADTFQQQPDDLLRIASIVGALEKTLADYPDLLTYARGMAKYAQGEIEAAQKEFDKIRQSDSLYELSSQGLPLPCITHQQVEIEQRQSWINLPLTAQFLASLAVGVLTSSTFWVIRAQLKIENMLLDPFHPSLIPEVFLEASAPQYTPDAPELVKEEKPDIQVSPSNVEPSSSSQEKVDNQEPFPNLEASPELDTGDISESSLDPVTPPIAGVSTVEPLIVPDEQDSTDPLAQVGEQVSSQLTSEDSDSETARSLPILPLPLPPVTEAEISPTLHPLEELLGPEFATSTEDLPNGYFDGETIIFERFEVFGSTVFSEEDFAAVTAPFTNRPITFVEILEVRSAITQLYIDQGYIASGAFLPNQQSLSNGGVVSIQVIEGTLEIVIRGLRRLQEDYVRSRIEPGLSQPPNINQLLERIQKLLQDPLIDSIQADLQAGTQVGSNTLVLWVTEAN